MGEPQEVLLLLGGNIGDPRESLGRAERLIMERAGPLRARSRDHWTEPWGFRDDRLFLNRALIIESRLEPTALMEALLAIEAELGRVRHPEQRFSARAIDIDILLMGERVVTTAMLTVPHPRLHERAFALEPAADVAPSWMHPVLGRSVLELLNALRRPA